MTSLIQFNYNINFILSNFKALALIYYIRNDTIKQDYSQHQYVIGAVFVQNFYDKAMQQHEEQDQVNRPRVIKIDKFSLRAFNCLAYNHEISRLLAANMLLSLPKFYISKKILKRINIKAFQAYFPKIIFQKTKDKDAKKTLISFGSSRFMTISLFNNYYY